MSPLGVTSQEQWKAYLSKATSITWNEDLEAYTAALTAEGKALVQKLRKENSKYERLDPSVLYAILTGRMAVAQAGWSDGAFGINVGSSRGATQLFERYYEAFTKRNIVPTQTSPSTTLGNISSWVAQDLKTTGPDISHSITCSTSLHSLLNGVAWIQSGMADKFLVGGSEAAVTAFTIAQMRAMKLTPQEETASAYPSQAMNLFKKKNTMALGEGAAMACLESGNNEKALAYITGVGYATEALDHAVSLSANGTCFVDSMKMALGKTPVSDVDAIVMHAPGTIRGDLSEMEAIKTVYGEEHPLLTTNKWKVGHSFGASGMLSLELAILMLQQQTFIGVSYLKEPTGPKKLETVMINSVGFGGNAVSVLVSKS